MEIQEPQRNPEKPSSLDNEMGNAFDVFLRKAIAAVRHDTPDTEVLLRGMIGTINDLLEAIARERKRVWAIAAHKRELAELAAGGLDAFEENFTK